MGLFSSLTGSLKKSKKLQKLQKQISPPNQSTEDLISELSEVIKHGTSREDQALEEYLNLCESDEGVAKVIGQYNLSRDDLKLIHTKLTTAGLGQYIKGHYAALSTIAYYEPLLYYVTSERRGESWLTIVGNLLDYWNGAIPQSGLISLIPDGREVVVDEEEEGIQKKVYPDGSEYVGDLVDGIKHGQGTYTCADGKKYMGEWKDGKPHGQGTQTCADGKKYMGEWKDGKQHGQGTQTWPSGEKYVGEYKDGKLHGQGAYTWANGNKYEGEWKDDKKHGQGTYTWDNGNKYVGEWRNRKQHGQGTMTYADGNKYVGEWKDGEKHGKRL